MSKGPWDPHWTIICMGQWSSYIKTCSSPCLVACHRRVTRRGLPGSGEPSRDILFRDLDMVLICFPWSCAHFFNIKLKFAILHSAHIVFISPFLPLPVPSSLLPSPPSVSIPFSFLCYTGHNIYCVLSRVVIFTYNNCTNWIWPTVCRNWGSPVAPPPTSWIWHFYICGIGCHPSRGALTKQAFFPLPHQASRGLVLALSTPLSLL